MTLTGPHQSGSVTLPRVTYARLLPLIAFLVALSPRGASAQDPRPRIGLVLSGGGARGLAHVGVLRELEAMRVPIDVVAGTSMGAIVGGLYAAGLAPDEIAAAVDTLDWATILSETPPRSALDFRVRTEERRTPVSIEVGLTGGGVRLPGGLLAGQRLGLLLRRHTVHVAAIESFAELPTPFAAVATDIERAERVVLRSGDLVEALRASMAIPVIFSPVEIDGRILVDGGIVDNLPVDVAREMGAEIVIAVDTTPRLQEGPELRTLLGISDQLVTILGRHRIEEGLANADVAMTPDLEEFDLFEFEDAEKIVERGAAAVRDRAADFDRLVVSEDDHAAWRRSRRPPTPPSTVDRVVVEAPPNVDPRRLRARIDLGPGDPLDVEALETATERIFALGAFERVGYDVDRRAEETVVTLRGVPKPLGPSLLRFGLRLVTDSGGADIRTGIVTFTGTSAWTRSHLNALGGQARLEARVGQTNAILAELHQPLDFGGRWFVEPGARLESTRQPLVAEGRVVAEYDVLRTMARIDAGWLPARSAELRVGLVRGRVDAGTEAGPADLLPALDEDLGAITARLTLDRVDDADWPSRGFYGRANALLAREGLGSDRDYERLSVEARGFATRDRVTGFLALEAAGEPDGVLPAYDHVRLGGFLSLSGFGPDELRGDRFAVGRAGALVRLTQVPPALHGVYAGGWIETGDAWSDGDDPDPRWAATATVGAETILGPAWLAYGRGEGGRERIYVALGVPL